MSFSSRLRIIFAIWTEFLVCRSGALPLQSLARRSPSDMSLHVVSSTRTAPSAPPLPLVMDGTISFLDIYDAGMVSYVLSSSKRNIPSSTAVISSGGAAGRSLAHIEEHYPFGSAGRGELRGHVRAILSYAQGLRKSRAKIGGSITLGFCAPNLQAGLDALKGYVGQNALPRGLLHGMDIDGVPVEISGAVYIRYCSGRGQWHPGDAKVDNYDGEYEGVYVNVDFGKNDKRQWGVMPLDLFVEEEGLKA